MKVVLDTNVIVSGLNFPGNERLTLDYGRRGRFELVLSPFILAEVAGVLTRKFDWSEARASRAVGRLREVATMVEPSEVPDAVAGAHAGNCILACAADARADYLVTGDRRHLQPIGEYAGTRIVRAPAFLTALEQA